MTICLVLVGFEQPCIIILIETLTVLVHLIHWRGGISDQGYIHRSDHLFGELKDYFAVILDSIDLDLWES